MIFALPHPLCQCLLEKIPDEADTHDSATFGFVWYGNIEYKAKGEEESRGKTLQLLRW